LGARILRKNRRKDLKPQIVTKREKDDREKTKGKKKRKWDLPKWMPKKTIDFPEHSSGKKGCEKGRQGGLSFIEKVFAHTNVGRGGKGRLRGGEFGKGSIRGGTV